MYASATSYVFDVVPSLDSSSASSLPGTLLWPGTQLRETGLLSATSFNMTRTCKMWFKESMITVAT